MSTISNNDYGNNQNSGIVCMKRIQVGSDFSGVGAFNQALNRLNIIYDDVFACEMDKYARATYLLNYGNPLYFPNDVYNRSIPKNSLDIYMTSPPCQAFSLAGKRLGKKDKRGILFFNSLEFIRINNPRFFIFENVRGLLSDDDGKTFREWVNFLGGKSVNGLPVIFPYEDSVPYHLYYKVLNSKDFGVPQNRERIFLIGIRDDIDNIFTFPKEQPLTKTLKDILEDYVDTKYILSQKMTDYVSSTGTKDFYYKPEFLSFDSVYSKPITTKQIHRAGTTNYLKIESESPEHIHPNIDEKYFLSQTMIDGFQKHNENHIKKGTGFLFTPKTTDDIANCIRANASIFPTDNAIIGTYRTHKCDKGFRKSENTNCPTIPARAREDGSGQPVVKLKSDIRRLTPRECFRLMDFPDTFMWNVSDSQAYKMAGNSIVVAVLEKIIGKLKL